MNKLRQFVTVAALSLTGMASANANLLLDTIVAGGSVNVAQQEKKERFPQANIDNWFLSATCNKGSFINSDSCQFDSIRYNPSGETTDLVAEAKTFSNSSVPDFKRHVIIVSGFDPLGDTTSDDIWNRINNEKTNRLGSFLLAQGFDITVLNFKSDSKEDIERNGVLLAKYISAFKNTHQRASVIGLSLGGVITRYALTGMELFEHKHGIDSMISYDSPQQGAHIPLGLRYLMGDLADGLRRSQKSAGQFKGLGNFSNINQLLMDALNDWVVTNLGLPQDIIRTAESMAKEASAMLNMLAEDSVRSDAAKQVLYSDSDDVSRQFFNNLKLMGDYPAQVRKVAFSNGNVKGQKQDVVLPAAAYVDHLHRTDEFNMTIVLKPTIAGAHVIRTQVGFEKEMSGDTPWTKNRDANTLYPINDNTAGSYWDWFSNLSGEFDLGVVNLELGTPDLIEEFGFPTDLDTTFIPTKSALDIRKGHANDDFRKYANNIADLTPFDEVYYMQNGNTQHMHIPESFVKPLRDEVLGYKHDAVIAVLITTSILL